MKTGVLMVWTGCLVSITLSVLHFAWIATAVERVLVRRCWLWPELSLWPIGDKEEPLCQKLCP